jgi:hypothetical protein
VRHRRGAGTSAQRTAIGLLEAQQVARHDRAGGPRQGEQRPDELLQQDVGQARSEGVVSIGFLR